MGQNGVWSHCSRLWHLPLSCPAPLLAPAGTTEELSNVLLDVREQHLNLLTDV